MISIDPTTRTSITVRWPSQKASDTNSTKLSKSRSETPHMCSNCPPTTGQEERDKLETRTTTMQTRGLSFAFWHHAARGASTQPRRVKLPRCHHATSATEVFGFLTLCGQLETTIPECTTVTNLHKADVDGIRNTQTPTFQAQMKF